MKAREPLRSAVSPLVYWLVLVCGLGLLTVARQGDRDLPAIWIGTVTGAAVGQLFAHLRLRIWLATLGVGAVIWMFAILTTSLLWMQDGAYAWLPSMAAAALGGYFSLGERSALLGLWFPAVLWMLPILDGHAGRSLGGGKSLLLLGALASLLLFAMWAREARRVALWQAHATVPLARALRRVVLRRAPMRAFVAQQGVMAAIGASVVLVTAFVAPHLWHEEKLDERHASRVSPPVVLSGSSWIPVECCPEPEPSDVKSERVSEYLTVRPFHTDAPASAATSACVACRGGTLIPPSQALATGQDPSTSADPTVETRSANPGTTSTASPSSIARTQAATTTAPPAGSVSSPTKPPIAPPVTTSIAAAPPTKTVLREPVAQPDSPSLVAPLQPSPASASDTPSAPERDDGPFGILLASAIAALSIHFAVRALRRHLTLRHLVRPMWRETIDQRVSNLWLLMLVGLRDAGWHTSASEQPNDLARRVDLEGMALCATVLERARHGVRVDAEDLESMDREARAAYGAARRKAGFIGRLAAWVRWPLI